MTLVTSGALKKRFLKQLRSIQLDGLPDSSVRHPKYTEKYVGDVFNKVKTGGLRECETLPAKTLSPVKD